MSRNGSITIAFVEHASSDELSAGDSALAEAARQAAERAYAVYSNFHVGAALRMADGTIVTGNNQENASFPAGICAERTALHAAMSADPQGKVTVMAVMVPSVDRPVSPCGVCRQALVEQEHRQGGPMRVLLVAPKGPVLELASARDLLPLSFDASFLKA